MRRVGIEQVQKFFRLLFDVQEILGQEAPRVQRTHSGFQIGPCRGLLGDEGLRFVQGCKSSQNAERPTRITSDRRICMCEILDKLAVRNHFCPRQKVYPKVCAHIARIL